MPREAPISQLKVPVLGMRPIIIRYRGIGQSSFALLDRQGKIFAVTFGPTSSASASKRSSSVLVSPSVRSLLNYVEIAAAMNSAFVVSGASGWW